MKYTMQKSPLLFLILLSLSILIISGCKSVKEEPVTAPETAESSPVEESAPEPTPEPTEEVSIPALTACNATEKTPGGNFAMCSPVNCDDLNASFPISYNPKEPVESCSMDSVVGICTVDGVDKIYYDGEADSLKSGCGFSSGEWSMP